MREVTVQDSTTADRTRLQDQVFVRVANRIVHQVDGIYWLVYDIGSK
jgi:GMP synthase PP-ATPase subunit